LPSCTFSIGLLAYKESERIASTLDQILAHAGKWDWRFEAERWGFDPELLYLASTCGLAVAEVSVAWSHREETHVCPLRDGLRMLGDILAIRWNAFSGKYTAHSVVRQPL